MPRVCSYGWKWVKKKLPWPSSLPIFFPFLCLSSITLFSLPFPTFTLCPFPIVVVPSHIQLVSLGSALSCCTGSGQESQPFGSRANSLLGVKVKVSIGPWPLFSLEFLFPGTCGPGNFRSLELFSLDVLFSGTFASALSCCTGSGQESQPFCSRANLLLGAKAKVSIGPWPLFSMEFLFPGTCGPGNFRSLELFSLDLLFPGTFAPGSECSRELSFPGTFALWNFCSHIVTSYS